jgi:SAM-dependent methyltransferase
LPGIAVREGGRRARAAAREQWGRTPAGTTHADAAEGTAEFFAQMTASRYRLQPWHPELLHRFAPEGRLLEIGSGAGTDHAELAGMAATTVAMDLAPRGAALTQRRLRLEGRPGSAVIADGERMPLASAVFDAVYSFGVIHHTDHPEAVAAEMHRVLRPGGRFLVAVYHRASLFALQKLLQYVATGAFLRETWRDHLALVEAGADQVRDRPLVRLYSRRQARALFSSFDDVSTEVVHAGVRWRFLHRPLFARRWGWYLVVTGRKPGPG